MIRAPTQVVVWQADPSSSLGLTVGLIAVGVAVGTITAAVVILRKRRRHNRRGEGLFVCPPLLVAVRLRGYAEPFSQPIVAHALAAPDSSTHLAGLGERACRCRE
jgi:hypothetical protein